MGRRRSQKQESIEEYREISYRKNIIPKNEKQKQYIQAIESYPIIFGIGSPGTGKSYVAVAQAVKEIENNRVGRIVFIRPAVATESLGFLPGTFEEKLDPYLKPLFDALYDRWSPKIVQQKLEINEIEIAPLAFMRGRTLSNCFLILDEAQNTTKQQMLMFLTRLGENVIVVITGDPQQSDLGQYNGLLWAIEKLKNCPLVSIIDFKQEHIIRSELCREISLYIGDPQ